LKTDDLVALLARDVAPVATGAVTRRFALSTGAGIVLAIPLMIWLQGINPQFADITAEPMFWVKLAFVVALLAGALIASARLARPGFRLARTPIAIAAPVLAMWALAAYALLTADFDERSELILGVSWTECPRNIATLAVPSFLTSLWAMKGLAPTRLRLAGAAAGLLAGAIGALVYLLHCPELAAPFLGLWYVIGMLIPTVLGALVGPRVLRW